MNDDLDYDDEDEREPRCPDCCDTGKVVAMNGEDEYMGRDYVPCHCEAAFRHIGRLGPICSPYHS